MQAIRASNFNSSIAVARRFLCSFDTTRRVTLNFVKTVKTLIALLLLSASAMAEWAISEGFKIEGGSPGFRENVDVIVTSCEDEIKANAKKLALLGYNAEEIAKKQEAGVRFGTLMLIYPFQFQNLVMMRENGEVLSRFARKGSGFAVSLPDFTGKLRFRLVDLDSDKTLEFDLVRPAPITPEEERKAAAQLRKDVHTFAQKHIASDWKLPSTARFSELQAVDDKWTACHETPEKGLWVVRGIVDPAGSGLNRLEWKMVCAVTGKEIATRFSQLGSRTTGDKRFADLVK
jgi:hypothetical protein